MEKFKNFVRAHKALVAISSLVVVIGIIIAILLLSSNENKLPVSGSDTTVDNSSKEDDYSSESNGDELPNDVINPDEEDTNSEDSTAPVAPDTGDDKNSEDIFSGVILLLHQIPFKHRTYCNRLYLKFSNFIINL